MALSDFVVLIFMTTAECFVAKPTPAALICGILGRRAQDQACSDGLMVFLYRRRWRPWDGWVAPIPSILSNRPVTDNIPIQ